MDVTPRPPDAVVRGARLATLAAVLALAALGLAWELWLAPTGRGTWAIKVLPLLPCLPGLWLHRMRTYRWLSLLLWLYVGEGLVRATSEHGLSQQLASAQTALAVLVFASAVVYIRRRQGNAAALATP